MKWFVSVLIACSLLLPFGTSLADQSTAPGQQKKAAGEGSAKEYAPGQDKDSAAHEKAKPGKGKTDGAKTDEGKASSSKKAASSPKGKAKAKKP
jgi:hypothetical protein